MIYLLLFFIFYPILDALFNYFVITEQQKEWHFVGALKYLVICSFLPYMIYILKIPELYMVGQLIFIGLTLRWVIFDIFLNWFRCKKWYYVGNTAFLDRFLGNWQFIFKIFFLIYSIIAIVSLFYK